jgi:hypothetical protein
MRRSAWCRTRVCLRWAMCRASRACRRPTRCQSQLRHAHPTSEMRCVVWFIYSVGVPCLSGCVSHARRHLLDELFSQLVQVAFQQADYVAWNLWAAINNRPLLPFR